MFMLRMEVQLRLAVEHATAYLKNKIPRSRWGLKAAHPICITRFASRGTKPLKIVWPLPI